jgi:hypothetical protein
VSKAGVEKISPAVEDTAKLNEKLSWCLWQLGLTPKSVKLAAKAEPLADGGLGQGAQE